MEGKSHGMDGGLVEPDWPPLTREELRRVLPHFPECAGVFEISTISPRPFSAASVVALGEKNVLVKRHHRAVRDREGLTEEHRFIEHLRARNVGVPRVLATEQGETSLEVDEWTYEIHEAAAGVDSYRDAISWTPFRSVEHAFSAGQTLARLHVAASGFNAPARKIRPLVSSFTIFAAADPAEAMQRYLEDRPAPWESEEVRRNCELALDLLRPFHEELRPLLSDLGSLWTHNDLHASNLFWSDASDAAGVVAVIDFGLADRTNAVHDLAIAIERNVVEWLALLEPGAQPDDVPVHSDHLLALLDGYSSVRPLSSEEAAALAPMTALCHAEFALTEADYFLGVLKSPEKAWMAHNSYLLGHARWFRSEAGGRMLDGIRRWADHRTGKERPCSG